MREFQPAARGLLDGHRTSSPAIAARLQAHAPVAIALASLWFSIGVLVVVGRNWRDGHGWYVLDDSYIHMAIAKHLLNNHVWGITPHEFTSCTSSLLWPVILAGTFGLTGIHEVTPFLLNLLFSSGVVVASYAFLRERGVRSSTITGALLAITLFGPLGPLTFTGLEHSLQMFVDVLFVWMALRVFERAHDRRAHWYLAGLAALVTSTRYEGAFLVASVCLVLALRRQLFLGIGVGTAGALPLVSFGLWSVQKGWSFFPNSLLLKASLPGVSLKNLVRFMAGLDDIGIQAIFQNGHVLLMLLAALGLLYWRVRAGARGWDAPALLLALFTVTTFLHMQFARVGWFYRYEAYLVVLGVLAIAMAAPGLQLPEMRFSRSNFAGSMVGLVLVALLMEPFVLRAGKAFVKVPPSTQSVHEQQYQMGRFLKAYYDGRGVAANDIGAINFLADLQIADLAGLADKDIMKAIRGKGLSAEVVGEVARKHQAEVAIVYDDWFVPQHLLPEGWTKVAEWTLAERWTVGGQTVSFYALSQSEAPRLREHLIEFSSRLPSTVSWRLVASR